MLGHSLSNLCVHFLYQIFRAGLTGSCMNSSSERQSTTLDRSPAWTHTFLHAQICLPRMRVTQRQASSLYLLPWSAINDAHNPLQIWGKGGKAIANTIGLLSCNKIHWYNDTTRKHFCEILKQKYRCEYFLIVCIVFNLPYLNYFVGLI